MGAGASTNGPSPGPELTQLHEMVYEVYDPRPELGLDLEIIFFHGLEFSQHTDAYKTTWMSYDNSHLWLKTWLVEKFPKARILTIAYDSSTTRTAEAGNLDMYCTTENLIHAFTTDSVRVGQERCPVVLVGHCVGGLVLKDLCVSAAYMLAQLSPECRGFDRLEEFFSSIRGMFFYGTPHLGSLLGDQLNDNEGALAVHIKILEASNTRRNEEFLKLKKRHEWVTGGIGEGRKTFLGCLGKSIYVVEEASSRAYTDSYYNTGLDHFNICKPRDKNDIAFERLTYFLSKVQENGVSQARLGDILRACPEDVIDLEGRVSQVQNVLAKENANKVFITGLSGIGKTTLAEQVFNEMRPNFGVTCFVSLESIEPQGNCKEEVLKRIHDRLAGCHRGSVGRFSILDYLERKKVLMVLDNVQSQEQLEALCTKTWLDGSASRLIVTSTNSRLGTTSNTFQVPYLTDRESRQLFLNYAFEGREGPNSVAMFIDKVIRKCENFPLSLKILGSYVGHEEEKENPQFWKELIQKMDKAVEVVDGDPDFKLWARLRLCYDALGPAEQELFLDIATTFCGFSFSMVECIWNGCQEFPVTAFANVKKRFLASVGEDGKIWMHTQLRDLGRSIACPRDTAKDKWQRIFETTTAKELIANNQGVVGTRSLKLQNGPSERLLLRNTTFRQFVHLQYLMLNGVEMMTGQSILELPPSLVYLSWTFGSFEICPVNFRTLARLCVLDLSNCRAMKSLPSSLIKARKLTWLELQGCSSLTDLRVFKFPHLSHLGLNGIPLTNLPKNLTQCRDLRYLLAGGTKLTKVPQWVDGLAMLVFLDLSMTSVTSLPAAIGNLKSLKELHLWRTLLCSLPESVGELQELQVLKLSKTPLQNLPESVGNLPCLKCLEIFRTKISALPDWMGELVELQDLGVFRSRISGVPAISRSLPRLESFSGPLDFKVHNCLQHLASLKFLKALSLDIIGNVGEEDALGLGAGQAQTAFYSIFSPLFSLHALTNLHLYGENCSQYFLAPMFTALQHLPSLSRLDLLAFPLVEVMPYELGTLTRLTTLLIWDCERLRELPESLGSLCMLTELWLARLSRLSRLPESLHALRCLSWIQIDNCENLENFPRSFGHMSPLEQEGFSLEGNRCETSSSFEHKTPNQAQSIKFKTDSWRLLDCFLECCQRQILRSKVVYFVSCEDMEKVMKEATQESDGGAYVLDANVAGELFRGRRSYQRRQASGVHVASSSSESHFHWNSRTDRQRVEIVCKVYIQNLHFNFFEDCAVHTMCVPVMDTREKQRRNFSRTSGNESDSEIEEDEVNSSTEEDEADSAMNEAERVAR